MVAAVEVDSVVWNAPTSPDDGCAPELAAYRHGHGRVQVRVPCSRLGELLDMSVELVIATFDQQSLKTILGCFKRNHYTGGASTDHS
jgi:hypothetical protein